MKIATRFDFNRAIISNVAMQVVTPGDKRVTNASSSSLLLEFSLQLNLYSFSRRDNSSSRINNLVPLCLDNV